MMRKASMAVARRLPHPLLRRLKSAARHPRYQAALWKARRGFRRHGDRYPQPLLFVAGLPKAGTSWLEAMLASYPGYAIVPPPEATTWEERHGGTHRLELTAPMVSRLRDALCVVKLHCHGSDNNLSVLREAGLRYCVLYRDLRDAAVSYVFYVRRTPWHPEHPAYRDLTVPEGLVRFARTLLPEWRDWIWSWVRGRDPDRSLLLSYEELRARTRDCLDRVATLFELPTGPLDAVVERFSFGSMKRQGDFYRRGVAGDWPNHFDSPARDAFKQVVGRDLTSWGYERDLDW